MMHSATGMRLVKDFNAMNLDDGDEDVLCGGEPKEKYVMDAEESNPSNMQQTVSIDAGDDWYMMLLDSFKEDGKYLSDNPLRSIRYEVDNGGYDNRVFKEVVTNKRSRDDRNTIRVTKKNVESKSHVQASKGKKTKEAGSGLRRRGSLVTEKSVEAKVTASNVKRNSKHDGGDASKKEKSKDEVVFDEVYRSYFKWLVENSKNSRTNPEKEIEVKRKEDDYIMPLSDSDSDVIMVGDRPFLDEKDSPFVPSKSYKVIVSNTFAFALNTDLLSFIFCCEDLDDENGDQGSSWYRKEITNILKQPYTDAELKHLHDEASARRCMIKCRQLQDGREITYETKQKSPSYLDGSPDFKEKYLNSLHRDDSHEALNLLRGLIFYLKNVVHDDAFKPWLDQECLKIRCS